MVHNLPKYYVFFCLQSSLGALQSCFLTDTQWWTFSCYKNYKFKNKTSFCAFKTSLFVFSSCFIKIIASSISKVFVIVCYPRASSPIKLIPFFHNSSKFRSYFLTLQVILLRDRRWMDKASRTFGLLKVFIYCASKLFGLHSIYHRQEPKLKRTSISLHQSSKQTLFYCPISVVGNLII